MSEIASPKSLPFEAGDLVLEYTLRQPAHHINDSFARAAEQWGIRVTAEAWDEARREPEQPLEVGWAAVTLLRRDVSPTPNLWEVLDSISGDHETVGSTILDVRTGDLNAELESSLMMPIGDLLICDRTWIAPPFRGHQLGLLIKAMTIRMLGRGCACAITYPAPFEGDLSNAARRRAITRLGRHWSRVGFKHFKNGVWILDLAARTFDDAVKRLSKQLGW